jgi:mono/diheme cytochrome c family protein
MTVKALRPRAKRALSFAVICVLGLLGLGATAIVNPKFFKPAARWISGTRAAYSMKGAARPAHGTDANGIDFAKDVEPILSGNCVKCHGPEKQKGGLRFDIKDAAIKMGESGDMAIVPGAPAKSSLIRRVTSHDVEEQMPPKGERLSPQTIAILQNWIEQGASWPQGSASVPKAAAPGSKVTEKDRKHWAFLPIVRTVIPRPSKTGWVRTPIDNFILAAQESRSLQPNPEAPRRKLIRRAYFDVLGLPPPPQEIDAFERDPSPDAYERLVDRLLADPHYGERWGRHWLDAARYADSAGYEEDRPRPDAFRYRDFVIRAVDSDLPYDKFIQWQIAGDLLEPDKPEAIAATGFIAAAPNVRPDFINFRKKDRCDELDDIVSTTGSAILGLTVGCARCHDHKFDPISTEDYYRLTAFFTSTERVEASIDPREGKAYDREMADYEKRLKAEKSREKEWKEQKREELRRVKIEALPATEAEKASLRAPLNENDRAQSRLLTRFARELEISDGTLREQLNEADLERWKAFDKAEDDIRANKPAPIPRMLAIKECASQKTHLLVRGDPEHEGPEVAPAVLSLFSRPAAASLFGRFFSHRTTRMDLARWLTDDEHGAGALTARVEVNRLWQHHFGRGLVGTPGDFGLRGDSPTNPQLLEWLAGEFIRSGWRVKPLQKMILMSAVYRQDDTSDSARVTLDPANQFWWRREPQRIEAEILRDSILSVSGCLNPRLFGPAVKPRMNPEAISITNREKHYDEWPGNVIDGPETWRRSIYIFSKRSNLFPFLQAFDAPNAAGSCTRRNPTTVAPQALALLNDPFVREQARAFAVRLSVLGGMETRVRSAFELAFGRDPGLDETTASLRFIGQQVNEYRASSSAGDAETAAVADFCQGLIALNEFSYID